MEVVTIATRYGDICIGDVAKKRFRAITLAISKGQWCCRVEQNSGTR